MLIFDDPMIQTREYLLPLLRERFAPTLRIAPRTPSGSDWMEGKPWLVVLTVAGTGAPRKVVYEQVLIGFHCYAPSQDKASELAGFVRSLLMDWPNRSGRVAGASTSARPADATDSTLYPAYYGSVRLLFKGRNG